MMTIEKDIPHNRVNVQLAILFVTSNWVRIYCVQENQWQFKEYVNLLMSFQVLISIYSYILCVNYNFQSVVWKLVLLTEKLSGALQRLSVLQRSLQQEQWASSKRVIAF